MQGKRKITQNRMAIFILKLTLHVSFTALKRKLTNARTQEHPALTYISDVNTVKTVHL